MTPTGSVQFTESDGTPIGPPVTLNSGKATLVASADAGQYTVRANYGGDANFEGSSGTVAQRVNRASTAPTIISENNPVAPRGNVTFDITVRTLAPGGVQPAGVVAITVDGQDVSGPIPLFDDGPTAASVAVEFTAPNSPLTATIGAVYSGDANTNPSSAAMLMRALRRRGFAALKGTTETLTVGGAGTLTQQVFTPAAPKSALASKKRPVLIASGAHTFTRAGKGTLTLRLTAAGRRAVRRAKSLKVQIVTRFAPASGTAIVAVTRTTIKARTTRARQARSAIARGVWSVRSVRP